MAALSAALAAPLAAGALAVRPRWRTGWRERIGAGPVAREAVWIHAASVGEVTASARLVQQLRARGHALNLSTTSATGQALCEQLHPGVAHRLAPLDHPWCVDAVMRRASPRALVLVETELWPVWIAACDRHGVPVVVVSGRTQAGEEEALLAAQRAWERAGQRAALILAPRHPHRSSEVLELARRAGRRAALRGERGAVLAAGDVGVLDTIGELSALYARAAVAYVGGTLAPVGGHNVLEPVAAGTPVVYGTDVANVRHAAELLERIGAGQRVADATELAAALSVALAGPDAARARGRVGRAALQAHRGSSERSAELIEAAIAAPCAATGSD